MNKCIFLDRDGVLNKDKVDYVYHLKDHFILDGVVEALKSFKANGFLLIIITNQSGIAKGIYKRQDVFNCFEALQNACGHIIDGIYFSPYHPDYDSNCLTRKPGSLMFEKAIAKYKIDISQSWMVGDKKRDIIPAKKLGLKTVWVKEPGEDNNAVDADLKVESLLEASKSILSNSPLNF